MGFLIDGLLIIYISKTQLSPQVLSFMTLNFKMIFYLPIYPFLILLFINSFRILSLNKFNDLMPVFSDKFKINLSRILAFLIDWLIVIIIGFILYKFQIILWVPIEILLVNFAYRLILETTFSRTIGKNILGISIIRIDNEIPTIKDILIRNLSKLTLIYWIPIFIDNTGLHDRLSKTRVIKTRYNTAYAP
jgi:hypothetical protein